MARKNKNKRRRQKKAPSNKTASLRLTKAYEENVSYQRKYLSTPEAINSNRLQEQADQMALSGQIEPAHQKLIEALEIAEKTDIEEAISRACHNLAHSYERRIAGVPQENLTQALNLLERTLNCKARQRDKLRLSLTHDLLGRIKRNFANRPGFQTKRLLSESKGHLREAYEIVSNLEPLGSGLAARYANNLGNVFINEGNTKQAKHFYQKAQEHIQRLDSSTFPELYPPSKQMIQRIQLNLLNTFEPNQWPQTIEAIEQLEANKQLDGALITPLRFSKISALIHSDEPTRLEQARGIIKLLLTDYLDLDQLKQAAAMAEKLDSLDDALAFLTQARHHAFAQRHHARADHVADHAMVVAQQMAKHAAWLHHKISSDPQDAIQAFLALENSSSMRYYDAISAQTIYLEDEVDRHIYEHRTHAEIMSAFCEDMAARLVLAGDQADVILKASVAETKNHLASLSNDDPYMEKNKAFIQELEAIETNRSIYEQLNVRSEHWYNEVLRLDTILRERDPTYRQKQAHDFDTTPEGLLHLLDHDNALMRVCMIEGGLLMCLVWRDNDALMGCTQHTPVDSKLFELLSQKARAEDLKQDEELTSMLLAIHLGALFDRCPSKHLTILPSKYPSLLPWAAINSNAGTLVERFDSITYLPMLTPMMSQQAPSPPRKGTLLVAPGEGLDHPTQFHKLAFKDQASDRLLAGDDATSQAVEHLASTADVISFYTHGGRSQLSHGELMLSDGPYSAKPQTKTWFGCERVELWACQTGINLPHDFLTPDVDESFGQDTFYHGLGVRSTISTLWEVPDLVCALIVRRYRAKLALGYLAPEALVRAQRWWLTEGIRTLTEVLTQYPIKQAMEHLSERFDVPHELITTLGPAKRSQANAEQFKAFLEDPLSWAGYKFMGVCERRPEKPYRPKRALTDDEQLLLDELLDAPAPAPFDQYIETQLETARAMDKPHPSIAQASRVARLYWLRRRGSRRHNLLRGLTWLHEAMSQYGSNALQSEAAWLWLELARDDLSFEHQRAIKPADTVLCARIEALVDQRPDAESQLIGIWLRFLNEYTLGLFEHTEPVDYLKSLVEHATSIQPSSTDLFVLLRQRLLIVELIYIIYQLKPETTNQYKTTLVHLVKPPSGLLDRTERALFSRIKHLCMLISEETPTMIPLEFLDHKSINKTVTWMRHLSYQSDVVAQQMYTKQRDDALSSMFHDGAQCEHLQGFWAHTSTPSAPLLDLMSVYIHDLLSVDEAPYIHRAFEAINTHADLRIAPMRNLMKLALLAREEYEHDETTVIVPWRLINLRHIYMNLLEDITRLFGVSDHGMAPYSPDAYAHSAQVIAQGTDVLDMTGWLINSLLQAWEEPQFKSNTATFDLERYIGVLDNRIEEFFSTKSDDGLLASILMSTPDVSEEWMETLLEEHVLLGITTGHNEELIFMATWSEGGHHHHKTYTSPQGASIMVSEVLRGLLSDPRGHRQEAFEHLSHILKEGLHQTLEHFDAREPKSLMIFSPGMLRPVPWTGLICCSQLGDRFKAISSLLQLHPPNQLPSVQTADKTMCISGLEPDDAQTRFGRAVITARRRLDHPICAEPGPDYNSRDIIETDVIEAHQDRIKILRMYGKPSPVTLNPSTAGIELRHHRAMTIRNLSDAHLAGCTHAEVWAAHGGFGEARGVHDMKRDVVPEFVRALFVSGAQCILDLAWPIPDLVKALVYEAFGRHHKHPPDVALTQALVEVQEDLSDWRQQRDSFGDMVQALRWLDRRRRQHAHTFEDVAEVLPFAGHDIEETPQIYIDRMCLPVHLASFRWWCM